MATYTTDVVVYGNSMCALLAAKAISARGKTIALVNDTTYAGGLTRGGLTNMDIGHSSTRATILGGYTRSAFLDKLDVYYSRAAGTLTYNPEPKAVTSIVTGQLLTVAGLTNFTAKRVSAVSKTGTKIDSIVAGGDTFTASVFLDASYCVDLAAMAGASCITGREAAVTYNESTANFTGNGAIGYPSGVLPYNFSVLDSNGQRIYGCGPIPRSDLPNGSAYYSLPGFNFRVCLTNSASKKVAFTAPSGYDASRYQILLNLLANNPTIVKLVGDTSSTNDAIFGGGALYTGGSYNKWDCNTKAAVSSNLYHAAFGENNISWAYIRGNTTTRTAIMTEVYKWIAGLLYFCTYDPSMLTTTNGTAIQVDAQQYGYCNDEFSGNWFGQQYFPSEMYVRAGRRLVGQYVMTEADVKTGSRVPDPVCRFDYTIDHHAHQRYPLSIDVTRNSLEGGLGRGIPTTRTTRGVISTNASM